MSESETRTLRERLRDWIRPDYAQSIDESEVIGGDLGPQELHLDIDEFEKVIITQDGKRYQLVRGPDGPTLVSFDD